MDSGTMSIAVILVALCIAPFFAISFQTKKHKKDLIKSLNEVAKKHPCTISKHEICGDIAIGLCEAEMILVFYKRTKAQNSYQCIPIKELQKCSSVHIHKTIRNASGNYTVIAQLGLMLTYKNQSHADVLLEFYNLDGNLQLDGELQLMERWQKILHSAIQVNQKECKQELISYKKG